MIGSLYYNAWIGLLAFTLYFLANFQTNQSPLSIILSSLMWAVIAFILIFVIRAILGYIFFTPEAKEKTIEEDDLFIKDSKVQQTENPESEEVANVVKTMLQQDGK